MDGMVLGLFLLAAFLGGLTNGLTGFALGLVVSGIWLHIITPLQTAVLIVGFSLVTQGYGIWKLRHALVWRNVAPFIIGGLVGVPAGAMLLAHTNPAYLRTGVGVLLVIYSVYSLVRPKLNPIGSNVAIDAGIGALNGLLAGLTGLVGVIVTIWCQLRGLPKDAQRTTFQPVMFASGCVTGISLAFAGAITGETLKLYFLGLPVMLIGMWSGFKLYGRLNDETFRKIILLLLLLSGLVLIVPFSWFR